MMQIVVAGLGAIFGSMARFSLLELAPKVFGKASAWMVMVINLSAALLIGFAYGMQLPVMQNTFWATGILGGYSTFSTPIVALANGLQNPGERFNIIGQTLLAVCGGRPCLATRRVVRGTLLSVNVVNLIHDVNYLEKNKRR